MMSRFSQGAEDAWALASVSGLEHVSAENTDVCENVSLQRETNQGEEDRGVVAAGR